MRLVSWNILAGGGSRCSAIAARLQEYDADVIVLQETVSMRGPDLCHVLGAAGYEYCFSAPRGSKDRGLCILSRLPIQPIREPPPPHAGIHPRGWLEVEVVGRRQRIAAVYAPAEGPSLPAFWDAAAPWLACRTGLPFIIIGDFNAGASGVDAANYRFKAGPGFAKLAESGLVDLWRREHGDKREHTWFSRPAGGAARRGFRIDHAFASPGSADVVTSCRYDHEVRERGWSDHSLLALELTSGAAAA